VAGEDPDPSSSIAWIKVGVVTYEALSGVRGVLSVTPGPAWHVIGAGDGNADLLWQNNDGTRYLPRCL
jgi:hypothetical protein